MRVLLMYVSSGSVMYINANMKDFYYSNKNADTHFSFSDEGDQIPQLVHVALGDAHNALLFGRQCIQWDADLAHGVSTHQNESFLCHQI